MGIFDSHSKKPSNERRVDELIQTVKSDPKARYEALVSLKKIGDTKAIDTFYKRLNDPSSRIRKISIEALGEMGNRSAIDHLQIVVDTQDFSKGGKKTNYGHPENISLAKEAIRKIQRRLNQSPPEPINTEIPQSPSRPEVLLDGVNWTNNDILLLKQSWGEGKFIKDIAKLLNRSPELVVHKLIDTGLIGYNDDNCYPKPARLGLKWSDHEKTELISEKNAGKSIPEIANIHQRNKNSIFHMMVSLKTFNYMDRSLLEKYYEKSALKSNNPPTSVKEKTEKIIPPQKTKEFSNQYEEEPAEGELPRLTLGEKILKIISTNPKDRKIQEKLEKIKKAKIEVTKKINYILEHDIPKIKDDIQSTYVKAIKSSSKQEEIFLAKRIKNLDLILNSKWEILGKLQRIQHYYERILAVGDIGVSLKDFGLGEFSETEIEDMTYDVIIGDAERTKKIELTDVVTSIPNNSEAREEDLKDILDEIRLKKEVIKE